MDQWDTDIATLGVYPAAAPYPELVEQLLKLYRDRVSKASFVPSTWLAGVEEIAKRNPPAAPTIVSPYKTTGEMKLAGTMPDWLLSNRANADAWAAMAQMARAISVNYAAGKITEGREEMERAYGKVEFWNGLISVATTIANAPANIVGSVVGGVQSVAGGIMGKLFGSWLFWLVALAAGGFAAWRLGLISLLKKRKG